MGTELVFEQREEAGGEYVFAFSQAGREVYSLQNDNPKEYTDLKVYFSNPWHGALPGAKIRNLVIETLGPPTTTTSTTSTTTATTTTTTTTPKTTTITITTTVT